MRMNLRRKSILAAVALTVVAAPIASAARDDRDDVTSYRARLTGFGEVPPKLVDGQGRFTGTLSADGATAIDYWEPSGDGELVAVGISEALINTAGGLFVAIAGIVAYNVFVTRVDNFNYMMDEASYEAVQLLAATAPER